MAYQPASIVRAARHGFSLVELSIVLVILGLLVGGVLGGQSLIKAAQLRNVLTEKESYVVATNAFMGKYNAIPGDMANATTYWTAADTDNTACLGTARAANETCNGDGNGSVSWGNIGWGAGPIVYENVLAWQHLSLAGLIPGSYTGYSADSESGYEQGVTGPRGKLSGSGWIYASYSWLRSYIPSSFWSGAYDNTLHFSNFSTAGRVDGQSGALAPEDASSIDSKIDDGKPGTGAVRTVPEFHGPCATSTTATDYATATYALSNTE